MNDKKYTTWEVLRYKFPENEYVLIAEVAGGNGYLDYMLVNLWNSRGLAITGIEKKSFRNDWLRELKNPGKQEHHFKFCDYFYLLTDKENVAKIEEIPSTWGWYHINEKGILKTLKPAPKQNPIPVNRQMLCNMIRRAAAKEKYVHEDMMETVIAERVEKQLSQRKTREGRALEELEKLREDIKVFEEASGLHIFNGYQFWHGKEKIGTALKALLDGSSKEYSGELSRIKTRLETTIKEIDKTISDLKI